MQMAGREQFKKGTLQSLAESNINIKAVHLRLGNTR